MLYHVFELSREAIIHHEPHRLPHFRSSIHKGILIIDPPLQTIIPIQSRFVLECFLEGSPSREPVATLIGEVGCFWQLAWCVVDEEAGVAFGHFMG